MTSRQVWRRPRATHPERARAARRGAGVVEHARVADHVARVRRGPGGCRRKRVEALHRQDVHRVLRRSPGADRRGARRRDLRDGLAQARDGARDLAAGTSTADSGAHTLSTGLDTLSSGAGQTASGAASLATGTAALAAGLRTATSGASRLDGGLGELSAGSAQLSGALQELSAGSSTLATSAAALSAGAAQLSAGLNGALGQIGDGGRRRRAGRQRCRRASRRRCTRTSTAHPEAATDPTFAAALGGSPTRLKAAASTWPSGLDERRRRALPALAAGRKARSRRQPASSRAARDNSRTASRRRTTRRDAALLGSQRSLRTDASQLATGIGSAANGASDDRDAARRSSPREPAQLASGAR